jgi:hypothetical protein
MQPVIERRRHAAALQPSDTALVRPGTAGVVTGPPLVLLRSEGVALLAMATVLYGRYGRSWWLFLALLPIPDLGLLGLLWSRQLGAVTSDLTHMDRGLGLGLHYPDGSGCTPLRKAGWDRKGGGGWTG